MKEKFAAPAKHQWYFRTMTLVIGFLFIGPLILPVVWFNPRYSLNKKIVFSCILLALTAFLAWLIFICLHHYGKTFQLS